MTGEDALFTPPSVSPMTCEELSLTTHTKKSKVCGFSADPVSAVCFDAAPQQEAAAVCDSMGARLCSADETMDDAVKATGCGLDRSLIWTNDKCSSTGFLTAAGSSSLDTAPVCTDVDEPTPFRCCADSKKVVPAANAELVAAEVTPIFVISKVGKQQECQKAVDATKAAKLCKASGARLCTISELDTATAEKPGCGLDNSMVWTGEQCGANSFFATTGAKSDVDAVCLPASDTVAVRCCTAEVPTSAAEQEAVAAEKPAPTKPTTIIGLSKVGKKEKCFSEKKGKGVSPKKAAKVCKASGARLCTASELRTDVAAGTGCSLDKEMVWTSESCGVDSFLVTTGANTKVAAECRAESEEASVRCCMDVEDDSEVNTDSARLSEVGASFMAVDAGAALPAAAVAVVQSTASGTPSSVNASVFGAAAAAGVAVLALAVVAAVYFRSRKTTEQTLEYNGGIITAV